MMIEAIPREKAESISEYIPGLLSRILTASDKAEYLLISSDNVFTSFNIAIVEDGFELIEANYDGDPGLMQSPTKIGMLPIIRQYL